jgi:hypothetical protein
LINRYISNGSNPLPNENESFVATKHRVLFNLTGSQAKPVVGIRLHGLVLRDTMESFLQPHGTPTSGDWALPYEAAVTMDSVERCSITGCLFTHLDGIAVELLGHARNVRISNSNFEYLGGSAIVLWGRSSTQLSEDGSRHLPSHYHPNGPDSRALDVPLDTQIEGCIAHDLGLWQKQSSMLFQAMSARTTLRRSVAYNLPRVRCCYA